MAGMSGMSGMTEMLRMLRMYLGQPWADFNDDGIFRNGGMSGIPGMLMNSFAYGGMPTQTPVEQLEFWGRVSGPKF